MGIVERKEREKEHRREEILDAAQKVFFERGLLASTMDEIAEVAELSKGTLYLYYKSKEDIYLAVMMQGMHLLFDAFKIATGTGRSAPIVLEQFGEAYIRFFNENRSIFRMMSFFQTPQFHKQVSEEMKQLCSAENHKIWDLVVSVITRGVAEGMLRSDLNPVESSIILWSSATALLLRLDAEKDIWKDRMQIDLEKTLRTSNMLFMDAILTSAGRQELSAYRMSIMHQRA